jgi:hypothetical protein
MALADSAVLGANATFQGRVQASLLAACVSIASEGNIVDHPARLQLVHAILASAASLSDHVTMLALSVAIDAAVISDATQAGTVALTTTNVPTQQALVTDVHINAAVSAQFNAYAQNRQV